MTVIADDDHGMGGVFQIGGQGSDLRGDFSLFLEHAQAAQPEETSLDGALRAQPFQYLEFFHGR